MVEVMTDILWDYLMAGNIFQFFVQILNYYFPFGLFFWMLGFVLFIIINIKTKSLGYASMLSATFFVLVSLVPGLVVSAYARMAMRYIGLIAGLVSGYYLYKAVKGT